MEEPRRLTGHLETPERVGLAVDLAGVGSRALACLLDTAIVAGAFVVLAVTAGLFARLIGPSAVILLILSGFLLQWFYFAAFEASWHGQTPGKRLLGIRVQRIGGYPIGWTEALIRNFLRLVDFLMFYAVGLAVMLLNERSQRIGDFAAGTVVVRERAGGVAELHSLGYSTGRPAPGRGEGMLELTPQEFETLHDFLRRRERLEPDASDRIQESLARALRSRLAARGALMEEWKQQPDAQFLETLEAAYREDRS